MNKPTTRSADKRLKKAAKDFTDMMERLGGGSVSINGVEIASYEDKSSPPTP